MVLTLNGNDDKVPTDVRRSCSGIAAGYRVHMMLEHRMLPPTHAQVHGERYVILSKAGSAQTTLRTPFFSLTEEVRH